MAVSSYSTLLRSLTMALVSLCLCCSCIDEYNADLPPSDQHFLVIDGSICGESTNVFHLNRSLSLNPTNEELINRKITDAKVRICGSDHSNFPAVRVESNTYEVELGTLSKDCEYWLEIEWEGRLYTSEANFPLETPAIVDMHYEQPREDMQVDILITPDTRSSNDDQFFRWDYEEHWEIHTPYTSYYDYDVENDVIYSLKKLLNVGYMRDLKHAPIIGDNVDFANKEIRNLRLYSVDNMDTRFNYLYCTTVTQKAITREQYEYEKLMQRQSDDMGGLFTPQPSELPSNIHCDDGVSKAIGYIGVTLNAAKKRLYIRGGQNVGYRNARIPREPTDEELAEMGSKQDIYNQGYRILDYVPMAGTITWVERWGVDCTAWGASLTPPDFWGEDYNPEEN